jgi:hypothetical protein
MHERDFGRKGDGVVAASKPALRDTERFKLLFTNSRPRMPDGKMSVSPQTTRAQVGARLRGLGVGVKPVRPT